MTKKINPRQERMMKIVASLQRYIATYDAQQGYMDYTDETLIDDVIYGLGCAIDEDRYKMAPGFRRFKDQIRKHLGCSKTELGAWLQIEED
jgi:hypothetical protein